MVARRWTAMNILNNLKVAQNMMLAAVIGILSVSSVPAQATMLQGHIEAMNAAARTSTEGGVSTNAPVANSYPASYQGQWHCVSTVVESGVADVPVGQKMDSSVAFNRDNTGRVVANWSQSGWTETQSSVTIFNPAEARVDRTNYFISDGKGSWAARSRDQYSQVSSSTIVAKSYIDQYQDGQFVGRYHTTSTLTKQGDIAMAR